MTAISSRPIPKHVSKFRLINNVAAVSSGFPTKTFVTQVRYDKEGRRIANIMASEPRVLLQLKREELKEREKQIMEKLERLKEIRNAVKRKLCEENSKGSGEGHNFTQGMDASVEKC
ncbi:hypothetical protein RB195_019793 [Necator americanus]|uniref:39S ribosomal protein L52, mitochondrial n=1 Tax=Necator americanus TaxID=51031 RepID=A0ABR1CFT5_NECAM